MRRLLIIFTSFFTFLYLTFLITSMAAPLKRPLSFQQVTPRDGLSGHMVISLAVQGEEIWFGTYEGGATLFDRSRKIFSHHTTKGEPLVKSDDGESIRWKNHLSYNHISVIAPDADRIWFGTYFYGFGGGGISYYHPKRTPPWKTFTTNDGRAKKVNAIAVDGDSLWVGSEKGLSVLDKKTEEWKRFYSTRDGLSGNFVNSILVQPDFLWIGTNGGVSRFNREQKIWKTYSQKDGLADIEIKSMAKIGKRIWAGATGGSLFEYDAASDRWRKLDPTDPLKTGGIQSILHAWEKVFVSRENGVSIHDLRTGQWESLTAVDGLLGNNVFCAAEDTNSVWFGTDRGASKLIMKP